MAFSTHSLSAIGGAIAALVAGKLLLTTRYAGRSFVILRYSRAFWGYLAWYAVFGFLITEAIFFLGSFKPELIASPKAVPLVAGSLLTIAKMKFADAFPVGERIEPWVRVPMFLFEPETLHQIGVDEAFGLREKARKHAPAWTNLELVKAQMVVPNTVKDYRRHEFEARLAKCQTAEDALVEYMRLVTVRWFRKVFSEPPPEIHSDVERTDVELQITPPRKSPRSAAPVPTPRDSRRITPP